MLKKKLLLLFFTLFLTLTVTISDSFSEDNIIVNKEDYNSFSLGNENAPISMIIYSSLSCAHCANFHKTILPKIKEKYVLTGHVKIIFRDFPLDLASLNASKLIQCTKKNYKLALLDKIYEKQNEWLSGTTIEEINKNLIKIISNFEMTEAQVMECLGDESVEEKILNSRITGQKKYVINGTPTIVINEKKFEGLINFEGINEYLKNII